MSIKEDTTMIFQWESPSATAYLKQLFSDETISKIRAADPNFSYMNLLSIGNGAIRPAGESYRDKLASGEYKSYNNKELDEFMKPTLGYMVYQEQIIEFLHKFCGFTMGEADVVRRHFSKKTGTEKDIPIIKDGGYLNENHYIKGFIQTMKDDYGVEKEESEQLIVDFLQVIIDASDYLFSKNHADPYSWIGYICGYLRYYYPLEFITTALNIFASKEKKSLAIINYAKKLGITISPIKFRNSIAEYNFNKETNQIYKGIASIKFMNEEVANDLYNLRNNDYPTFVDLIRDIEEKTTVNSRQMKILIDLDYFSEFGDANLLMTQYDLYDRFSTRSQIRKSEVTELGIPLDAVRTCAGKETEKLFTQLNTIELLHVICSHVRYTRRTLGQKIQAQIEHLGYISELSDRYSGMAVVTELDSKYSPKMSLYSLKNGNVENVKVNKRDFNKCRLKNGDIIMVDRSITKPKVRRLEDGTYQEIPNTRERWLVSYRLMNV